MKIHAFRRTQATPVDLFGTTYIFAPNELGHCVADVEDERAVRRLIVDIAEAYREYDVAKLPPVLATASAAPIAPPTQAPVPPGNDDRDDQSEALLGSDTLPATFEIAEGKTVTLGDVVAAAQAKSGLDVEEWNLNDAEDRDNLIVAEVESMRAAEKAAADAAAAEAAGGQNDEGSGGTTSMVVSNGEQSVDIGTMSATKVREFAAQVGVELPKGNSIKVGDLRQQLYDALTKS